MKNENMQRIMSNLKRTEALCEEINRINENDISKINAEMREYWCGETAGLFYSKLSEFQKIIADDTNGIIEAVDNVFDEYKKENSRL